MDIYIDICIILTQVGTEAALKSRRGGDALPDMMLRVIII